MIIKNFEQLATTQLRKDALTIVESGFAAIQTDLVLKKNILLDGNLLTIHDHEYDLSEYEQVFVIAFGKSSYLAAKTIEDILGDRITKGYAIGVTEGPPLKKIVSVVGTHPDPSDINHRATRQIISLLEKTTKKDLVLAIISGGGSALLAAPYKMDVEAQAKITSTLMKSGADIHELNVVRKHISEIKGGRLAALAQPAKLVTIIFSDVPGNDLSTIASGATVFDSTTIDDAQSIIEKYRILEQLGLNSIEFSETPKDEGLFDTIDNILVLDPTSAVQAMKETAAELGYRTEIYSTTLEGEAANVGQELIDHAQPGTALLAAGETTVTVAGNGTGGRNQQLVLTNLKNIKPGQVLISAASDGHDHSNSAGAIGDEHSYQKAKDLNLIPEQYAQNSDSFTFFSKTGDLLDTGILDSNIADMFLVLQKA